jgi:HEAT repeat protein
VREHALEALHEFGPAAAELLPDLRAWSADPSAALRSQAVTSMGFLGTAAVEAVPLLIEKLTDSHDSVFLAAVEALGRIGPDAAVAVPHLEAAARRARLIDDASGNYDWDSHGTEPLVVEALGNMGPAAIQALPLLLNSLDRYNWDQIEIAARILRGLGVQVVAPVLRMIPGMDNERESSAVAVVTHFGAEAVPFILRGLADPEQQLGAVWVIREWHEDPTRRPPELVAAVPLLAGILHKFFRSEAGQVIDALAGFGPDARPAVAALRECAARKGALYDTSPRAALRLLKALGEPLDEAADIRTRLADPDPVVRGSAVSDLIGPSALPEAEKLALYTIACRDADLAVRFSAIGRVACEVKGAPDALRSLFQTAAGDSTPEVRAAVAYACAEERAPLVDGMSLLLALASDASPKVRRAAVKGLGARGAGVPAAADAVRTRLADPDPGVFVAAVIALGALGALADADALAVVCPRLPPLEDHERQWALNAIGEVKRLPPEAAGPLLALLTGSDARLSCHVLPVLRWIQSPPPGMGRILRDHLKKMNPEEPFANLLAKEVFETLAAVGELTPADIPALVALLASDNEPTHTSARALLRPFGSAIVPAVCAHLPTITGPARVRTLLFLTELGSAAADALPEVLTDLNAGDRESVRNALHVLGRLGPAAAPAIPQILGLLCHEDEDVRTSARQTLAELGPVAVPYVERILAVWRADSCQDPNEYVDLFVALSAHTPAVVPALREFVRGPDNWRLTRVAEALGRLGPAAAEAVPDLLSLASRAETRLLAPIATALGQIRVRSSEVVATLRWLAEGENAVVRTAAADALARI